MAKRHTRHFAVLSFNQLFICLYFILQKCGHIYCGGNVCLGNPNNMFTYYSVYHYLYSYTYEIGKCINTNVVIFRNDTKHNSIYTILISFLWVIAQRMTCWPFISTFNIHYVTFFNVSNNIIRKPDSPYDVGISMLIQKWIHNPHTKENALSIPFICHLPL